MTDRIPRGTSPESWAEQQINDAIARGELDVAELAGKPLDLSDGSDPDWWIRRKLREEALDLPPSLQLRTDHRTLLQNLLRLPSEQSVRERAEHLNGRIRYANSHGITGPPVTLMPVDVEALVTRWREGQDEPPTT